MIPNSLAEWKQWAERFQTASLYYPEEFRAVANAMSEETFKELADFYVKAVHEKHVDRINAWLREAGGSVPMGQEEKAIRNLCHLFAHIAHGWGRGPFTDYELHSSKLCPPTPDWSKLPDEMRFLGEPAEEYYKFTYVFSEDGREHIQNQVTPQEIAQLSLVAEQVRRVGYKNIQAWWKKLGSHEHEEAAMVFNLMGVLDALDLPYYDPNS